MISDDQLIRKLPSVLEKVEWNSREGKNKWNRDSTAAPQLIMPLLVAQRSAVHGVALDHQFNQCFYQQYQPMKTDIKTSNRVQFTKIDQPLPSSTTQSPSNAVDRHSQQGLDFTMSKFKASSRHPLYRQYYGGGGPDESPPYEKQEEQGNCQQLSICQVDKTELSKQDIFSPVTWRTS